MIGQGFPQLAFLAPRIQADASLPVWRPVNSKADPYTRCPICLRWKAPHESRWKCAIQAISSTGFGHDLDVAKGLADSMAIMDRGRIVFDGETASLDEPDVRRHLMRRERPVYPAEAAARHWAGAHDLPAAGRRDPSISTAPGRLGE